MSFDFATSFPVAVEATFSQNWPGFAGLPAAHRLKLASLACSCIRNKRYRHSQDASAIFYPYAVRDGDFGRGEAGGASGERHGALGGGCRRHRER